jgi:hypothetical protein
LGPQRSAVSWKTMPSEAPSPPPEDPEAWTEDQWIEWLNATDEQDTVNPPGVTLGHKVTHSAPGSALGAAMLGMSAAIYGRQRAEVVIIEEAPGNPEDEDISLRLDPDHPDRSVAIIRGEPRTLHD